MPNLFDRLSAAVKALRFPLTSGGNSVSVYSSWNDWDASRRAQLTQASSDPSASSLVMSGVRWLGNRLPEAVLTVQEPDAKDKSKAVPDHDLITLFKRPNPFMSGSTMWKAFAFSWILKGDVYFIKWRNQVGRVTQLWYEPHWNVKPRWVKDGRGPYIAGENDDPNAFINYYQVMRESERCRVEVEDVIHFRDGIDPLDTRCGLSGIATILREILGDSQVADFAGKLLANGGVPPYVLSIDNKLGELKQEDIQEIKDRLLRQTTGRTSGEPLVITNATVEKLGFSPDELDLRVSRYLSEERFSAVTGIPSEVLQLGAGKEHSIYSNVSEARQDATQGYLVPLWWHISEELTVQLLPDFDKDKKRFVEHDTSEVQALQEDEDGKHARIGLDYQNNIITRAVAKRELDYDVDDVVDNVYFKGKGGEIIPADFVTPEPQSAPVTGTDPLDDETVEDEEEDVAVAGANGNGNKPPAKAVYHLSSKLQREKIREHWERHAPARVKGLITAKGR